MPGGIINRWIWVIDRANIGAEQILEKDGFVETWHETWEEGENEETFELGRMVSFNPPIVSQINGEDVVEFISGKMYYQDVRPLEVFDIIRDESQNNRGSLRRRPQPIKVTYVYDFWISINSDLKLITFNNSRMGTEGVAHLSEILFGASNTLKPVSFDISRIENDVKSGNSPIFDGMWAYHFQDRNGSISKGVVYADDRIDTSHDQVYLETAVAPKGFIGVKINYDSESIKVKVFRKGTFQIYKGLNPERDVSKIFQIIRLFEDYMEY